MTRRAGLKRAKWLAAVAMMTAMVGCQDRPRTWDQSLKLLGPHRVGARLMWVDGTRGLVVSLDPSARPPRVRTTEIAPNVLHIAPTPRRDALLVLTAEREALRKSQTPRRPQLFVIKPTSAGPRVDRRFELPNSFDRLAVNEAGTRVIVHHGTAARADGVFINPNLLAIIDLSAAPSATNPRTRTLRSFGSTPLGVVFSPPMTVPRGSTQRRTLAVVLSKNYLTLLDMANLQRSEISVQLTAAGSTTAVTPRQVVFAPDTSTIFARADGTRDVFALSLERQTATGATGNDFRPSINQPSAGKTVRDMLVFRDGADTRILTANLDGDLALIDAATSQFSTIKVSGSVDTIVPIPKTNPTTAIVYSRANPARAIHFLALKDVALRKGANLTTRTLDQPVHELLATPDNKQALVVHNAARTVVSMLNLTATSRTVTPILGPVALTSYEFVGRTHLAAVTTTTRAIGVLDLATLQPTNIKIDFLPRRIFAVGTRLVVDHGEPQGLVTVLPSATSKREDAQVLWGFLLRGLLNQELEE